MTPKELICLQVKGLPHLFYDLDEAKKDIESLEEKSGLKVVNLFDNQATLDRAKGIIKKTGFNKLAAGYFSQFYNCTESDFKTLKSLLKEKDRILTKHLGLDKVSYLKFICEIDELLRPIKIEPFKRKGLLQVVS